MCGFLQHSFSYLKGVHQITTKIRLHEETELKWYYDSVAESRGLNDRYFPCPWTESYLFIFLKPWYLKKFAQHVLFLLSSAVAISGPNDSSLRAHGGFRDEPIFTLLMLPPHLSFFFFFFYTQGDSLALA